MSWQSAPGSGVDAGMAERVGAQAGAFLIGAINDEVSGATTDPVQVLMDPDSPGQAVYALVVVHGPLRAYLATAWGRAGHVSAKQIVSQASADLASQALDTALAAHLAGQGSDRRYVRLGAYSA